MPLLSCSREAPRHRILLIGLDGAAWPTVQALGAEGKLPNLTRLAEEGAAGPCASLPWRRALSGHQGYWSPVLWSSIATGKRPDKHGVEDFVMPTEPFLRFWLAPPAGAAAARLDLPPLPRAEARLAVRARAPEGLGQQTLVVRAGERTLAELRFGPAESVEWVQLAPEAVAGAAHLELRCAEPGPRLGERSVCLELTALRLYDERGVPVRDLHPMKDRAMLEQGWHWSRPRERIPVASFHRRARSLWQILDEHGRRTGVVGWWTSWPAEPLADGLVYSSLLGVHGARVTHEDRGWFERFEGLAHPAEALERARELFFPVGEVDAEIRRDFYEPGTCSCIGEHQDRTFREFYWQDRYFTRLALDALEQGKPFDLLAVYLRGTDSTGHMFLHLAGNEPFLAGCTGERCDRERIQRIVEAYYRHADAQIGALVEKAGPDAITVVVTDHGQAPARAHGDHADNGFLILHGGPVSRRLLHGADILDVAPTLLYLAGLPVGQDMDGAVLTDAIDPAFLAAHPVRYVPSYEPPFELGGKQAVEAPDVMAEEEERLRALGYVE